MRRVVVMAALAACGGPRPPKKVPPPPPIEIACQQIANARVQLTSAEELLRFGQAADAYAAALHGIDLLGRDYASHRTKDDTGLHLYVAADLAAQGDHAGAAREAIGALESRIHTYERRYR